MTDVGAQPDWQVLLIGGSAGVGKSRAAKMLAQRFGVSLMMADDVRLALQQMTTPTSHPEMHVLSARPSEQLTPEDIRDGLIRIANALSPALEMICAHHVAVAGAGKLIIEGDTLLPRMAAERQHSQLKYFADLTTHDEIRAVFLTEPDEKALLEQMREFSIGFSALKAVDQERIVRASWLYGQWLAQEADAYGVPVVPVRPWDTLIERVIGSY